MTLITKHLGEFPLIGFFGNGEFAPIGRRNFFHNYTGVLVIFPERRPDHKGQVPAEEGSLRSRVT